MGVAPYIGISGLYPVSGGGLDPEFSRLIQLSN
jgi:hypothetical protein